MKDIEVIIKDAGLKELEDLKAISKKAGFTLTQVASLLSERLQRPYSVQSLHTKIAKKTIKYQEVLLIFELIGLDVKLKRKKGKA